MSFHSKEVRERTKRASKALSNMQKAWNDCDIYVKQKNVKGAPLVKLTK